MQISKEKFDGVMTKYGQCCGTGLEKKTAEAFSAAVQKSVTDSQRYADAVVNLISVRRTTDQKTGEVSETPADYDAAKEALTNLAKSVGPVAEHWRPFIEQACDALGVDVSNVLPRGMVPDPAALEKALENAGLALRAQEVVLANLETVNADLDEENLGLKKQLGEANARLESAAAALEAAKVEMSKSVGTLEAMKAENESLKSQLANATKADSGHKHDSKPGKAK